MMNSQNWYSNCNTSSYANMLMKSNQEVNTELLMKLMNQRQIYAASLINNNNNTQIYFPAGNVCNHIYNRTYINDNFNNNNINNISNSTSNDSLSSKKTYEMSENAILEMQEKILKNQIEAVLSKSSAEHDNRLNKPTKKNTNCPHLNARHYAKVNNYFNICIEYVQQLLPQQGQKETCLEMPP
jgi:hypothetical protein